jgi:glycosyltransferase involved in cell wall biosynthesis
MRILLSTTNLDLGGAQMFIMRLAEEFDRQGHEVFVYNHQPEWSNMDFLSSFSKRIRVLGYSSNPKIISFTWKLSGLLGRFNKNFIFRNWLNERHYRKTLEKFHFDVVNSQMYVSDRVNSKVISKAKVPFVITTHGEYELNMSNGNRNYNKEAGECISSASAVIYTAEKNIEAIRPLVNGKRVKKISIGFNGESIRRVPVSRASLGIGENDFVVGMVARGIPEKGWNELIDTFKLLKDKIKGRKVHLVMIGNGEKLRELFEEKKTENMHLMQFTKNPMEYFSWVSIFDAGVLLSYFKGESVPNTIIEYLFHGVPVLATPMGEIARMIDSSKGMAGELVAIKNERADAVMAAEILEKWITDAQHYQQLKDHTQWAFEKFRMKNIASQYLEVYSEVVRQAMD